MTNRKNFVLSAAIGLALGAVSAPALAGGSAPGPCRFPTPAAGDCPPAPGELYCPLTIPPPGVTPQNLLFVITHPQNVWPLGSLPAPPGW